MLICPQTRFQVGCLYPLLGRTRDILLEETGSSSVALKDSLTKIFVAFAVWFWASPRLARCKLELGLSCPSSAARSTALAAVENYM